MKVSRVKKYILEDVYIEKNNVYVPSGDSSGNQKVETGWRPATQEEIKRYNAYGKEQPKFVGDANNAYNVTLENAMQGPLCYDSFEAVLGDYTIGRTYNIMPDNKKVYKMGSKAKIVLDIPTTLQGENREYKMICVTENGLPIVLNDIDKDASTIIFETDTYYAFALIYK